MKPAFAVILVSVLFAGMQLWNLRSGSALPETLVQLLCAGCFGIWAGAAVIHTGSIVLPLLAHFLLNARGMEEILLPSLAVACLLLASGILPLRVKTMSNDIG